MKIARENLRLYAVTDSSWTQNTTLEAQVEQAIKGGATFIQLREKNLLYSDFVEKGKDIKQITDKYNIPFVINDDIDVAIAVNADGVHIGQSDFGLIDSRNKLGKDKIIGVSVQTVEQAILAEESGADYLGVGAVFSTNTKLDANAVDINTLKDICLSVAIPVIAIGGINEDNVKLLKNTGICGVAVVSAIFGSNNIEKSTQDLLELTKNCFE